MKSFYDLLLEAKAGNEQAIQEIQDMYTPLIVKNSIVDGHFDEDLFEELLIVF